MGKISGTVQTVESMKAILRGQGLDENLYAKAATAMDITLIDGEAEALDSVIAQANEDRVADLGSYGMTSAMAAEQCMLDSSDDDS